MKKLFAIFLGILFFVGSFEEVKAEKFKPYLAETFEFTDEDNYQYLVFSGATDNSKKKDVEIDGKKYQVVIEDKIGKIVSVYLKNGKLYYVYGAEGKPEIQIEGVPGKNLFKARGGGGLRPLVNGGGRAPVTYITFKNENYVYVLERRERYAEIPADFFLSVFKLPLKKLELKNNEIFILEEEGEEIFREHLRIETVNDSFLRFERDPKYDKRIPKIPSNQEFIHWDEQFHYEPYGPYEIYEIYQNEH